MMIAPRLKVGAYITAYQDFGSLQRCLNAIQNQTESVVDIYIVDNSPTPLLKNCQDSQLIVEHHPSNIGISGGLRLALERAHRLEYDFLWTFDQDSEPQADCLERLLRFFVSWQEQSLPTLGIVAPLILDENTKSYIGAALFNRFRFQEIRPDLGGHQSYFECDAPITSGSLISIQASKQVDLPRMDLFIDGVDLDYGLQLRKQGYHNLVVYDARMSHHLGEPMWVKLLGRSFYIHNYSPLRFYYFYRNHTFLEIQNAKGLTAKALALLNRLKCMMRTLISTGLLRERKMARMAACILGTYHGLRGTLGKLEKWSF